MSALVPPLGACQESIQSLSTSPEASIQRFAPRHSGAIYSSILDEQTEYALFLLAGCDDKAEETEAVVFLFGLLISP